MLKQIIYRSQPFGFDPGHLGQILHTARRNNVRDGITGALICRDDIYLQLLEGEEATVEALFRRIGPDDRHYQVSLLWSGPIAERMFPAWAMRDDPARSWMWSPAEVAAGAPEAAGAEAVRGVFERVAREAAPH